MTIDTPAGTINQITPIREFVELTTITNAQYLLGIQNMSTGNGSKITFGNLITSLISGNADNKLVKGSDDKLFISTPIEIGTLSNLTTTNKTNLVSAINELNSNMGSLSNLETTVKTSLVAAINSVAELTEPELLIDKVNQSKALVTGNVAGYQEELEQIKLMKRSTFDRSKFEIVGSPVITSNGIVSGFGVVNNIEIYSTTIIDHSIQFECTTSNHATDNGVFRTGVSGATNYGLDISGTNQWLLRYWNGAAVDYLATGIVATINTVYKIKITQQGTTLTLQINDNQPQTVNNFVSQGVITRFVFGVAWAGNPFEGSFDLKQISLVENGVEVLNGNKTGIDTIKPDDYTLGTELFAYKYNDNIIYSDAILLNDFPDVLVKNLYNADGSNYTGSDFVINDNKIYYGENLCVYDSSKNIGFITRVDATANVSIDGIWSNNSGVGNTIRTGINQLGDDYEIQLQWTAVGNILVSRYYVLDTYGIEGLISLQLEQNGRLTAIFHLRNENNTKADVRPAISNVPITIGTDYFVIVGRKNDRCYLKLYVNGQYVDEDSRTTTLPAWNLSVYIGFGQYSLTYNRPALITMDLNRIKIYKKGELIYQPMLNIPYYESAVQYGSKIVDAKYRERVLDVYEQGYKDFKYYTLDEENGNFTLPHGEIYGMLEQIRTENEQNNEAVRQIVDVKDNLYKILEGHQSTNKTLWDLITFTDNSEVDNLLIGGDSPYTSNSSSSNFHFYLLNSTTGSSYNPDDTAKANVYKLFNKSHFDSQSDPIYVKDGTIVITCANPTKLSKILLRSYDTNTALPTIITVCGANITNNMSREIVSSDFSSAKYIGGISQTKEAAYNDPTSTNWGLNRPLELTIDDKDTFNTFFINMSYWYVPSGTDRRLVGIKLYGTQMTNDDSDYTVKMSGEYENCKWIASNGNIYNTDDLYQQYGYIPKEKTSLARWVSCFGSGIGQANATTRAADQYYPTYISGSISSTTLTTGQPWYILRQTNYSAENRPQTGYNVQGAGYIQKNTTLNNQTVIDYTADSYFPVGEYYWEGIFGYNDASRGNCYLANWCQLQKVYDDDSVEIIQTFSKEGSMYESSVCYRTPRFYASRAFKKLRLIVQEENYPNNSFILSQMQLYYRDTTGTIARSFIPSATQYDLSYNTVKHKSNIHFFITPTGVRVGSNCFIQKTDPTVRAACVGNRWINENTKKSYVCNTSGVWTEEDFCEIGCMTMFGSKHVGMRLRTVANSENPMQKYIQDYEDIGGNLALNYNMVSNATTVITTSPTDPDYYFQAEAADENAGINFYMPANTVNIQAYRRALVKSKIYQSGQQFAHWSNSSRMGAVLMAYKTFDTSAAGEYIEGSEEEEQ